MNCGFVAIRLTTAAHCNWLTERRNWLPGANETFAPDTATSIKTMDAAANDLAFLEFIGGDALLEPVFHAFLGLLVATLLL